MQTDASSLNVLLHRTAGGDRTAFAALYQATSPKLFGVVLRILKQRAAAEDVIQDVYVRVWQNAARYEQDRAAAMTWLITIARNRALDEVRKKRSQSLDDAPQAYAVADTQPLAIDILEAAGQMSALQRCLEALEPEKRALVRLAYLDGLSREELGTRFGHPVATIKTWLHRSLKQLKGCLDQ